MEPRDLGFKIFTKELLKISSFWKVKPNVGSGGDGVDLSITGRYVEGLIYNSTLLVGTHFFSSGSGCTLLTI